MKTKFLFLLALGLSAVLLSLGLYFGTGLLGRKNTYHKLPPLPTALVAQLAREKINGANTSLVDHATQPNGQASLSKVTATTRSIRTEEASAAAGTISVSTTGVLAQTNRQQSPTQQLPNDLSPTAIITEASTSGASQSQVQLPLALIEPDPSLNFTTGQLERLQSLRQSFIDEVGGLNQNPNDPAYLRSWQNAQSKSDQLFKTLYGWKAYNLQLLKATQDAANYKPE